MKDPDVEANARLTGYVGAILVLLLAGEFVTGLRSKQLLPAHAVMASC